MRPRRAGQSTVEWLGVAVAVAVLALGVIAALPGVASGVGGGMERVVCSLGAAMGGEACAAPVASASQDAGETRTIVEATGSGGLRPGLGAGGPFTARTTSASSGGVAVAPVVPVTEDAARSQFAYGDPTRCRSSGPGRSAPQLCSNGVLRECEIADPGTVSVRCDRQISDETLARQATCAAAPNALAADPTSEEQLCRLTRDDGSTAIFRCQRDLTGRSADLRRCVDTGLDPYATVDPKLVRCPGGATGPSPDVRDGRKVWRFDLLCLSPGGSAYLCETIVEHRDGANDTWVPPTPTGAPDSCTNRTIPNDSTHGDGRDLLGTCTGGELAPGAPKAQTLRCTLPDDKTKVTCLELDQTIQHCARAVDVCTATVPAGTPNPLVNTGRRLAGPGKPGATGPVSLSLHALAVALQHLLVPPTQGTDQLAELASCPSLTSSGSASSEGDAPADPAPMAAPAPSATPQPDEPLDASVVTAATAFQTASSVGVLTSANGHIIASWVDGATVTDPSGPGDASAIPGHALDLLHQGLGHTGVDPPHVALTVTQADPEAPLTFNPQANTWTIGANHAMDPNAFRHAKVVADLSRDRPDVAQHLVALLADDPNLTYREAALLALSQAVSSGTDGVATARQANVLGRRLGIADGWRAALVGAVISGDADWMENVIEHSRLYAGSGVFDTRGSWPDELRALVTKTIALNPDGRSDPARVDKTVAFFLKLFPARPPDAG